MKSISTTSAFAAHRVCAFPGLLVLVAGLSLCACGPPWELEEKGIHSSGLITRLYGPPPESVWNKVGTWYRVSGEPATYLPVGYSAQATRSETAGTWIKDKRDGKRFFIPNKGVENYSRAALLGEARGIARWEKNAKYPYYNLP